jgi:hypothetical protein
LALLVVPIGILWRIYWLAIAGTIVSLLMTARWLWPVHRTVLETEA